MALAATEEFPGFTRFIAAINEAVRNDCDTEIAKCLRGTLCELIRDEKVRLPQCVFESSEEHYARRELYRSDELGYSVIAMTWGPGQGTPVHDHCGMWCVEGVWQGELEVVQYDLVEQRGDRYRFREVGAIQAGSGSAGSLIPPHEYHTICNASDTDIAVSVHVYSGCMTNCNMFLPEGGEWYLRKPKTLYLDA